MPEKISTKQNSIFNVIKIASKLSKVNVLKNDENGEISIINANPRSPDFKLIWDETLNCYQVFIYVGDDGLEKQNAGFQICQIDSELSAIAFVVQVKFLHKHRT